MHRLARKWPNKAAESQAQSTDYLHYLLEAQDPLGLLGLGLVQSRNPPIVDNKKAILVAG